MAASAAVLSHNVPRSKARSGVAVMRALLVAGVVALVSAGLSGCDWLNGQGSQQQASNCPCLREPAPPAEPLARLAPPALPQAAERRRHFRAHHTAGYANYTEASESFVERSYSSASSSAFGTYEDDERESVRRVRREPPGGGVWIDGFNRAHFISRNAELEARNAANMAVNSQRMHRTWFGYDKDCPEAFGDDGY